MSELQPYQPRHELAVSHIPEQAQALVEWAQSAQAAYDLATRLITTSFAPAQYKGKPDEAAAAMLAGAEVGLSPMASLRSFDVINGVAAPRAIALRAIVQSLGHEIVIDEATPTKVVGRGKRKGSSEWQRAEWTIQRATALGLTGKDQWKKQPQTMLIARVTSELARLIAADAILGIPYAAEELEDEQPGPKTTVKRDDAPKTSVKRGAAPEPEEPSFEEPKPAEEPAKPASRAQVEKLNIQIKELGITEREEKLDYISTMVKRPIKSSNDLTMSEASKLIDAMENPEAAAQYVPDADAEPPLDDPTTEPGWGGDRG